MYKYRYYGKSINVERVIGIFRCLSNSSIGKTYLCNLLHDLRIGGNVEIATYTYDDYTRGISLPSLVTESTELIFVDRLDLYANEEICTILKEYGKSKTVIVDLKHPCKYLRNMGVCDIQMEVGELRADLRK